MNTATPAIRLAEVSVGFPLPTRNGGSARLHVLEAVDLAVLPGEIVCVLGPSGCGKSTLLNVMAGFIHPDHGSVVALGKPVTGPGPDHAMVFQSDALFPWLTIRQNLEFGPRCRGDTACLKDIPALISLVGLKGFEDFLPAHLSGGMKQRTALARALVNRAGLLLLDEPFGALDAQTREAMQELLLSVHARLEPAIVFVTHDIDEALFLADRVLLMGPLPGAMREEVRVPLPRPRIAEMRDAAAVLAVRAHLRRQLRAVAPRELTERQPLRAVDGRMQQAGPVG